MEFTIQFNGKTYKSLDEMPDDIRRQYEAFTKLMEDKDKNGIPDILERGLLGKLGIGKMIQGKMAQSGLVSQKIIVQGKEYSSLNDVPAEYQAQIKSAIFKTKEQPTNDNAVMADLFSKVGQSSGRSQREKTSLFQKPQDSSRHLSTSPKFESTPGWLVGVFLFIGALAVLSALGILKF